MSTIFSHDFPSHIFATPYTLLGLIDYLMWPDQATRHEGIIHSDQVRLFQMGSTNASPIQYDEVRIANMMELGRQKDQELPLFSFFTIQTATNDFAKAYKLGEGGFGPVYKVSHHFCALHYILIITIFIWHCQELTRSS